MYTKLPVQRLGIIADNIKTTALRGALWSKGADDYVASRFTARATWRT